MVAGRVADGAAAADAACGRAPVVCERFDDLGADGTPARLGFMGGTFDPVHYGHLACAEEAREALRLDGVVFIPTGRPAFKRDRPVTPGVVRLALCRAAVADNPAFDVSPLEVERPGITYAVDTLRTLRDHYPANVELVFIAGADAVSSLPRWRESDQLAHLARFAAAARPGYAVSDELKDALAAQGGFVVDYLTPMSLDISSSDLRERAAAGRSLRYLTPEPVRALIGAYGLYRASGKGGEK